MTRKRICSLGVSFGFLFVALLSGQVAAGEAGYDFVSCAGWANCSTDSPNYTGICCRPCRERERGAIWDCRRIGAERERLGGSSAGQLPAGEATITGIVTKEGVLQADQGHEYAVAGDQAVELQHNMGKKIEVKGTVQEAEGKVTIDVDAYELMGYGATVTAEASHSCANWLNCDSRAPTFTGTCCRQCAEETGGKLWDCKVFSEGEHFDLAEWSR
ncbi:MAG: hypothetical protein JRJ47_10250 [Deltaproteobacteria bacterium]|nr:hypothetical protein [Deltaproteobacteria bacterium]